MSKKKIIILSAIIIIILSATLINLFCKSLTKNNNRYITLVDAYLMANEQIDEGIFLYTMTSADLENIYDKKDSNNGKRRFWNLDFTKLGTTEHFIFQIRDGVIEKYVKVKGLLIDKNKLITFDEIQINSNDALTLCKTNYEIFPGDEWAFGYHFMLNKYDGVPTITVTGFDYNNNFIKISINTLTKHMELNISTSILLRGYEEQNMALSSNGTLFGAGR